MIKTISVQLLVLCLILMIGISEQKSTNDGTQVYEILQNRSFFEKLKNYLKTSPEELEYLRSSPSKTGNCVWKICSRPINLRRHHKFNNIEDLRIEKQAANSVKNGKPLNLSEMQLLAIKNAIDSYRKNTG